MEKDAEAADANHAPEREPRRPGHDPGRDECCDRSRQSQTTKQALTFFFIHQRVDYHDGHAEKREHNLWQDANVVGCYGQALIHWPTTLLVSCTKGVRAVCTAGSMMLSQSRGATPIMRAATAVGQS